MSCCCGTCATASRRLFTVADALPEVSFSSPRSPPKPEEPGAGPENSRPSRSRTRPVTVSTIETDMSGRSWFRAWAGWKLAKATSKCTIAHGCPEVSISGVELEITHSPVSGERYGAAW